jgi:hypothetical protein
MFRHQKVEIIVMFSRREILAAIAALSATIAYGEDGHASPQQSGEAAPGPDTGITAEAAQFSASARFEDLPPELIDTGKIHILDAIGLAIAGERAETGGIVRRYLSGLGSAWQVRPRLHARLPPWR